MVHTGLQLSRKKNLVVKLLPQLVVSACDTDVARLRSLNMINIHENTNISKF